jgi:hypothetical protein
MSTDIQPPNKLELLFRWVEDQVVLPIIEMFKSPKPETETGEVGTDGKEKPNDNSDPTGL